MYVCTVSGSVIVGIVNFVTTLVSTYLIDKFGRKVLLCAGTYLMYVCSNLLYVYVCMYVCMSYEFLG